MVLHVQEFKEECTENYPLVKLEDAVIDLELQIYDPKIDDVVSTRIGDYRGSWLVLFFYPADFTFVCPTELKDLHKIAREVEELEDVEILVGSTDTVFSHRSWVQQE